MKNDLQLVASDKVNWFKNHTMSEEQRKKLIEDKLKRAFNRIEIEKLEKKTKVFSK